MQHPGAVLQKVGEKPLVTLSRYWGATERGWGHEERATSTILVASSMTNTGEPARDGKESGKEAGATRTESSEALQAVRWGRGVGVWESHMHGEGPEGEGRETGQRYPGNAQAVHHGLGGILAKWQSPYMPLSREPCAVKVACTVLTGGLGKRAVRQRALILPTYVAPASSRA